jgi:hypothetical protein
MLDTSTSRRISALIPTVLMCLWPVTLGGGSHPSGTATCDAPGPAGVDVRVTTKPESSYRPELVWTGTVYGVVWTVQDGQGVDEIRFIRLDASGSAIGDDVSTGLDPGVDGYPVVAWSGADYGIAYAERLPPDGGGNWVNKVFFQRLHAAGDLTGNPVQVSEETGLSANRPAMLWNGTQYALVWEDYRDQAPWAHEIYFNRLDVAGAKVGPDVRVSTGEQNSQRPALAWTGTGYGVAWQDRRDDNWEIYFALLDAAGSKIGVDLRVTDDPQPSTDPSVVWTGSEYGVCWVDRRDGQDEVYFARIDAAGNKIGADVRISDTPFVSVAPSIAWNGSEYGIVWTDGRNGQYEVYFALVDAMGGRVGADVRLTYHEGTAYHPSLVYDGTAFAVAWGDDRDDGYGFAEVYFNRVGCSSVDTDGDGVPDTVDCDETDPAIWPTAPQICDDARNNDCNHPNWPDLENTNEVDDDGDGLSECAADCDDTRESLWTPPGETRGLRFERAAPTYWLMRWDEPFDPGGTEALTYDAIRSDRYPDRFDDALYSECIVWDTTNSWAYVYPDPFGATLAYYLTRAENDCPEGKGSLGFSSDGRERAGRLLCP